MTTICHIQNTKRKECEEQEAGSPIIKSPSLFLYAASKKAMTDWRDKAIKIAMENTAEETRKCIGEKAKHHHVAAT
eukprot:1763631-Ditylum_brightwellii.AAC.1